MWCLQAALTGRTGDSINITSNVLVGYSSYEISLGSQVGFSFIDYVFFLSWKAKLTWTDSLCEYSWS